MDTNVRNPGYPTEEKQTVQTLTYPHVFMNRFLLLLLPCDTCSFLAAKKQCSERTFLLMVVMMSSAESQFS